MRAEIELNTVVDRRPARAPHFDLLIIGGGYAGAVTAIHVLRRTPALMRLAIVEPRARLCRGVAYGSRVDCHLLNTRAKRMSLRPHDDQHYTHWAQSRAAAQGFGGVDENSFTPRGWFGDYVEQELNATVNATGADFTHLRHSAVSCQQAHYSEIAERGLWQ